MPTFTLLVREAGKLLGETQVSIPELTFVPDTVLSHLHPDGSETAVLGWAGRLWAGMHEPVLAGEGRRRPISAESFARLANAAPAGNPQESVGFRNPFEPDRFLRPLGARTHASRDDLLDARLAEVRKVSHGLAVIDGFIHRAVPEPVHVVNAGYGGIRVGVRFREGTDDMQSLAWNVFRADRGRDAAEFASDLAERRGVPVLEPTGWLRVVYSQILKVDDVGEAFAEAFRRYLAGVLDAPARMASRIAALPRDLTDPGAAGQAYDILRDIGSELASSDMSCVVTREVCDLVAMRYGNVDRDWLAARAAPLVFAP
jgi:hypothetical protein